ncbi:penicillin-binding transpeptidase domain-containing protein [Pseudoalteromonas umbrosa]|uniref:penicillin-binding transpeptidase domain-containing protein n=1 Tax=Pseudoalteromonas umbrosa TaxID=3048489 RepID=UPI0024C27FC5|nr:penicillin-binding transpeptidase domain-containing protein [Pseudoalteromonas sp. B95]MDK1288203.1 penicillin-binding transpeptidase domain-containing protein [Pseudoalteromonas sp. B95]
MQLQWPSLLISGLLLLAVNSAAAIEGCHKGEQCTMVVYSEQTDTWQIINKSRAERAFSPFSTYKIPNTLILLEKNKVDTKTTYRVNTKAYPPKKWWPNVWHKEEITLKEAFSYSVLPLYQDWTNTLNKPEIKTYLSQFDYGNQDINGPLDGFWLNSSIQVSAFEQIEFLRRLNNKSLGLSEQTYQTFDSIFLQENHADYQLYAKTGAGPIARKTYIGWYVGKIKNARGTHYFAFNMYAPTFNDIVKIRVDKARATLKDLGIL